MAEAVEVSQLLPLQIPLRAKERGTRSLDGHVEQIPGLLCEERTLHLTRAAVLGDLLTRAQLDPE